MWNDISSKLFMKNCEKHLQKSEQIIIDNDSFLMWKYYKIE